MTRPTTTDRTADTMPFALRTLLTVVLLALIAAAVPAPASAGVETIYTCRNADGSPGTDVDWHLLDYNVAASSGEIISSKRCGAGGWIDLQMAGTLLQARESAIWRFEVPAPLRISGLLRLERETQGLGPGPNYADHIWYTAGKADAAAVLDFCGPVLGLCGETVNIPRSTRTGFAFGAPDSGFVVALGCSAGSGNASCQVPSSARPTVRAYSAVFEVTDNSDPVVDEASGSFVTDGVLAGAQTLKLGVSDAGAGIYTIGIEANGRIVDSFVLDDNGGACRDNAPGNADPYEFAQAVPCPLSVSGSRRIDTSRLGEGPVDVRVLVLDATGNTTVAAERRVTVDNIPAPRATVLPTVGGEAIAGRTLLGGDGVWDAGGRATRTDRQWLRCAADGGGCQPAARTGASYDLEASDVGKRLVLEVTVTSDQGTTTARSSPSGVVTPAAAGGAGAPGGAGPAGGNASSGASPGADARGAANGTGAADDVRLKVAFDGTRATTVSKAWGRRTRVRGTLRTAAGTPIAGARVEHATVNANPGARVVERDGLRTDAKGRFALLVGGTLASRRLVFSYRSHEKDAVAAATASLTVRRRTGVRLTVSPRTTSARGLLRFSGRMLGRPIPARGKLVELQARGKGGGRWLTFRTLRTRRDGSFTATYRLRRTYGSVTYVFRARARAETAYPFLTGTSKALGVRVR